MRLRGLPPPNRPPSRRAGSPVVDSPLQLVRHVVDDWRRTWRLVVLLLAIGLVAAVVAVGLTTPAGTTAALGAAAVLAGLTARNRGTREGAVSRRSAPRRRRAIRSRAARRYTAIRPPGRVSGRAARSARRRQVR